MWHPVGALPARVYWRRRLVVLAVLLAVLGGVAWLIVTLLSARAADGGTTASGTPARVRVPALERVVPSAVSIATPTPPSVSGAAAAAEAATAAAALAAPVVPAPVAGGPCTDDMIGLEVRGPGAVAVGSKPTFELVVTNVSAVPCVRALDKGLQEIQLYDAAGARVWGSNDCFPETSTDPRTLAPGEAASMPIIWGGLTSEPACTAPRGTPPAGSYFLLGRLDTKVTANAPLALS